MTNITKLFTLIIVFAGIGLMAFGTITLLAKQSVPDQNETPELYDEYITQQSVQKPFLSGFQILIIFILLAIIGTGMVIFLKAARGGGL